MIDNMLQIILAIVGILFTILFVIGTHEFAHFAMARLLNVKVLRFSIGFGKTLLHWYDKTGTEYIFALIPLGGYVQMADETEGKVAKADLPRAYNRQPFYKKFLIVVAGPLTNLICALLLYWLIFMIGFSTIKPIIGTVQPNSIAAKSGLKPQQEIISIDNKSTSTWTNVMFRLLVHAGNQDSLLMGVKDAQGGEKTYRLDLTEWHIDSLSPDPLGSLGMSVYEPTVPLVIGIIMPDSPAATSPLMIGDKIIAINHEPVKDWREFTKIIQKYPDKTTTITIERKNKTLNLAVNIGYQHTILFQKFGYLGVAPNFTWPKDLINKIQYGPWRAFQEAWEHFADLTYFNFLLLGKMLMGKLSVQSLGGPITIFEVAGSALSYGITPFLGILAFLSLSIGIINLLPIPGLDGGHLFMQVIEVIIRRPIPEKVLSILYRLGFALILVVLIQALINDILRLNWF